MKVMRMIGLIGLMSLSACATRPPIELTQTVGPPHVGPAPKDGFLVVYSAPYVGSTYADADHPVHSPYTIYADDGTKLEKVKNRNGSFDTDPSVIRLAPGKYRVKAMDDRSGYVIVPVEIDGGRTTTLDLDDTEWLRTPPEDEVGPWVRLPDGRIVGARAK